MKRFKIAYRREAVNEVAGFKICNFIKKRLRHSCFPVNVANFIRTAFSIEHLRWLLLCLLEWEESESVEQRRFFKWKKKMKTFHKKMKTFRLTSTRKFWC